MLKILNIIGARPQIIKAAAISRAIKNHFSNQIEDIIVHTGQHYDENMSEVFFTEMGIPSPKYNLNVGSASHGVQTAEMLKGIESIIFSEKPNVVLVYGDTNSTLAAAVAAAKLHVLVAHVEAGLRSFNKSMPEEINRITCDHASTLLFSPTETGIKNLVREGFKIDAKMPYNIDNPGVFHCGDVMYDN
ncbi:MAG: UDP-N-acetylglucosamine 2-epimerase (non-hydrolyzing), partial [Bacteroidetes bacterium CG_4_10_14_3_um_filter_31_20]